MINLTKSDPIERVEVISYPVHDRQWWINRSVKLACDVHGVREKYYGEAYKLVFDDGMTPPLKYSKLVDMMIDMSKELDGLTYGLLP